MKRQTIKYRLPLFLTAGILLAAGKTVLAESVSQEIVWRADSAESVICITEPGTYRLSGRTSSGYLEICLEEEETAELILDNVQILNEQNPGILARSGNVKLVLEGTDNKIAGGNEENKAAVCCEQNMEISGKGNLQVIGTYDNGIKCEGNLTIYSGTILAEAAGDAVRGDDNLYIEGGSIQVTGAEDGLKANNEEDPKLGNIFIRGGEIILEVSDDAMHAEGTLEISGGTVKILSCNEGIEGHQVRITGGDIDVTAADDAVNANGDLSALVHISGGELLLEAQGDGIDSNGKMELEGGTVIIHGTTSSRNSPMDYDAVCRMEGGILAAAGSASMPQAPKCVGERSTLRMFYDAIQVREQLFTVRDEKGAVLLSFLPRKDHQVIILSHPLLKRGMTVKLSCGGSWKTAEDENTEEFRIGADVEGDTWLCTVTLEGELTSINQKGEPCEYMTYSYGW